MKATAPEKIYISPKLDRRWYYPEKVGCYDTEYVRTDAFIEKACEFLKSYRQEIDGGIAYIAGIVNDKTIEDFKNYMEGE